MLKQLLIVVCVAGALALPLTSLGRISAENTWAGTWNTNYGKMVLQAGGSGAYDYCDGKISGSASGNKLTGTWTQKWPCGGATEASGPFEFTLAANGKSWTGRWRYTSGGDWHTNWYATSCAAGECLKNGEDEAIIWPPLPDALVPLSSVSNGCGGGPAGNDPKDGDVSDYVNSEIPFADLASWERSKKYHVNFREACKQHDAGYSHAKVKDMALNGSKVIDYFTSTKAQVDTKFLEDMWKICDDQVPKTATVALRNCKQSGGFHTEHGAKTRYNVVAATTYTQYIGIGFYQEAPRLTGTWSVPGVGGPWSITQSARMVTAKWTGGSGQPNLSGEFRGTIISHDDDSSVEGFYVITDNGKKKKPRAMKLFWNPKTPDQLRVSTGFTLTR